MAPKKKKKSGKKGKLAKMTEEERILYMEQKALAEEEMRKKKEDMLNQFLKVWMIALIFTLGLSLEGRLKACGCVLSCEASHVCERDGLGLGLNSSSSDTSMEKMQNFPGIWSKIASKM